MKRGFPKVPLILVLVAALLAAVYFAGHGWGGAKTAATQTPDGNKTVTQIVADLKSDLTTSGASDNTAHGNPIYRDVAYSVPHVSYYVADRATTGKYAYFNFRSSARLTKGRQQVVIKLKANGFKPADNLPKWVAQLDHPGRQVFVRGDDICALYAQKFMALACVSQQRLEWVAGTVKPFVQPYVDGNVNKTPANELVFWPPITLSGGAKGYSAAKVHVYDGHSLNTAFFYKGKTGWHYVLYSSQDEFSCEDLDHNPDPTAKKALDPLCTEDAE